VGLLSSGIANAALISESASFSPSLVIDGGAATTSLNITDSGLVTDLDVWINFSKRSSVNSAGNCTTTDHSFLSEIVFSLRNPFGTSVNLITSGQYSGGTNVSHVLALFDDSSLNTAFGTPVSGTFNPAGSLSGFNDLSALGDWVLTYQDTVGADPLALNSWGLNITTDTGNVPEPTSIALLGLGLAGLGFSRKKKTA